MTDDYKPVRPILRAAAVCLGLFFFAVGLMLIPQVFHSFDWSFIVLLLFGLVGGSFFIYVGITGKNFYWNPKQQDDE